HRRPRRIRLPSRRVSMKPVAARSRVAISAVSLSLVVMVSVAMAQQQRQEPTPSQPAAVSGQGQGQGPGQSTATDAPVAPGSQTFNTVITKLRDGKQIFSNTISEPDLDAAKKACEGQDFIWIEMQHSTLTWRETQQLIKVIAEAGCIPFVRVPS